MLPQPKNSQFKQQHHIYKDLYDVALGIGHFFRAGTHLMIVFWIFAHSLYFFKKILYPIKFDESFQTLLS